MKFDDETDNRVTSIRIMDRLAQGKFLHNQYKAENFYVEILVESLILMMQKCYIWKPKLVLTGLNIINILLNEIMAMQETYNYDINPMILKHRTKHGKLVGSFSDNIIRSHAKKQCYFVIDYTPDKKLKQRKFIVLEIKKSYIIDQYNPSGNLFFTTLIEIQKCVMLICNIYAKY